MMNNNPMQMISQFMQFRNGFTGNPKQMVEQIISSGRYNQNQINQAQNMARQFQSMMNKMR